MRILVFSTDDFLPPAGGAETAFGEVAKRLPEWQFEFICARLDRMRPLTQVVGNITIHRVGWGIPKFDGLWLSLFGGRIARRIHKKQPIDLVWSIMASYGGIPALNFKRKYNKPFLLSLQEGGVLRSIERKGKIFGKKYREIFTQATGVHAISHYLADWAQRMGTESQNLRVIPNGVDIAAFQKQYTDSEKMAMRSEWGWSGDAIVLVTTSRLVPKNGVADILNALAKLPVQFKLVICGDGSLKEQLLSQVKKLQLGERVRFLGFSNREEIPKILKASDIFIRPSLTEGLGNSFLEAMAAGIPVIGTPVGGIPDFLIDGANGFFCRPNDPTDLIRVVKLVASLSSESREAIVIAGKNTVEKKYSWDTIAEQMKQFIIHVCAH